MTDTPTLWSLCEQALAISSGQLRSRDLLEMMIDRIERYNPTINAVITRDYDNARQAADAADQRFSNGESDGALHGIPITVKDALCTSGLRATGGATELAENIPDLDAPVVASVKDEGAIVFGKTNLPRWSGDIQAYNSLFGQTNNPWDVNVVPGGSSGGAAAAVASGFTAFEIGTDIGGSIRFPAAYCGIYGHKPSFGLVPSTGYLDHEHGGSTEADINVIGPLARSAADLRLLMTIMMRRDAPWIPQLAPQKRLDNIRVAAWLDDPFCSVDRAILGRMEEAAHRLEASGIQVDYDARPAIDPTDASNLGLGLVSAATSQASPESGYSHQSWLSHHQQRLSICKLWARFFSEYDVILMPVSFVPPFPHLHEGNFLSRTLQCNGITRPYMDLVRWTILTGMAYLPSTVPPLGSNDAGLPTGIQVVGPYGGDYTTIAVAEKLGQLMNPDPVFPDLEKLLG